jgi:hypothetical protein
MYYSHPLIARHMRQFPTLRQPWRRYVTTYDPVAKEFERRQRIRRLTDALGGDIAGHDRTEFSNGAFPENVTLLIMVVD